MIKLLFLLNSVLFLSNSQANTTCPDLTNQVSCKGSPYPIHLTFDDGPSDYNTAKALNILKKEKVKGTFFVKANKLIDRHGKKSNSTHRSDKNKLKTKGIPNYYYFLLDRMKKEDHNIGSHTYNHIHHVSQATADIKFLRKIGEREDQWIKNIDKSNNVILQKYLDNNGKKYLRLPYGQGWIDQRSKEPRKKRKALQIMEHIKKRGFTHVGWNIDSADWRYEKLKDTNKGEDFIRSTLQQICDNNGGIVLMHDTKKITVDNLQCMISNMKKMNFKFKPIETFKNARTKYGLSIMGDHRKSNSSQNSCADQIDIIPQSGVDFIGNIISNLMNGN